MSSTRHSIFTLSILIVALAAVAPAVVASEPDVSKAITIGGYTWLPARLNNDAYEDMIIYTAADGCLWKWYGTASGSGGSTKRWAFQNRVCIGGRPGAFANARIMPIDFNGDGLTDL